MEIILGIVLLIIIFIGWVYNDKKISETQEFDKEFELLEIEIKNIEYLENEKNRENVILLFEELWKTIPFYKTWTKASLGKYIRKINESKNSKTFRDEVIIALKEIRLIIAYSDVGS